MGNEGQPAPTLLRRSMRTRFSIVEGASGVVGVAAEIRRRLRCGER